MMRRSGKWPLIGVLSCVAQAAVGQSFHLIPPAVPGAGGSGAYGVSASGTHVTGSSPTLTGTPGFVWTAASGRYDFGLEPGMPIATIPYAISGDGSTAAGWSSQGTNHIAFKWSGPGTYQTLGVQPGYARSEARGVSHDGNVIAGRSYSVSGDLEFDQAFRWTPAGGLQPLGFTRPTHGASAAYGVSRDGSTIVGYSRGFEYDAFRWTAAGGMQILPPLPGALPNSNLATAVNHNGTIIVGTSGGRAVAWRNGVASPLTTGLYFNSVMNAVNDDGTVIAGQYNGSLGNLATVWTPSTGMMRLDDYLRANGVVLPNGVTLLTCQGVDASGTTFVGRSTGGGFVATIPTPSSIVLVLAGTATVRSRRRAPLGVP